MKTSQNFKGIFFLFILLFGILAYLQYIAYSTSKSLIQSNKDLMVEMEFSNNIQFFQTHLILLDEQILELKQEYNTKNLIELERELNILKLTHNYIKTYLSFQKNSDTILEFNDLIEDKLKLGHQILLECKQVTRNINDFQVRGSHQPATA